MPRVYIAVNVERNKEMGAGKRGAGKMQSVGALLESWFSGGDAKHLVAKRRRWVDNLGVTELTR